MLGAKASLYFNSIFLDAEVKFVSLQIDETLTKDSRSFCASKWIVWLFVYPQLKIDGAGRVTGERAVDSQYYCYAIAF